MAVASNQALAVTSSATQISTSANTTADGIPGSSALFTNVGTVPVFLGGPGVTATTGYTLAVGASITLDLETNDFIFGVTASTSGAVDVLQTGL